MNTLLPNKELTQHLNTSRHAQTTHTHDTQLLHHIQYWNSFTHYSTYQPLKKNHQTLGTQRSLSSSELQLSQYIQEWGLRRGRGTVTCRKPTDSTNTFYNRPSTAL